MRRSAACSSASRWRSSRACVFAIAVATSSVKAASRVSIPGPKRLLRRGERHHHTPRGSRPRGSGRRPLCGSRPREPTWPRCRPAPRSTRRPAPVVACARLSRRRCARRAPRTSRPGTGSPCPTPRPGSRFPPGSKRTTAVSGTSRDERDLLGDGREHLSRLRFARDQRRDPPERGLLVDEPAEIVARLRVRDRGPYQLGKARDAILGIGRQLSSVGRERDHHAPGAARRRRSALRHPSGCPPPECVVPDLPATSRSRRPAPDARSWRPTPSPSDRRASSGCPTGNGLVPQPATFLGAGPVAVEPDHADRRNTQHVRDALRHRSEHVRRWRAVSNDRRHAAQGLALGGMPAQSPRGLASCPRDRAARRRRGAARRGRGSASAPPGTRFRRHAGLSVPVAVRTTGPLQSRRIGRRHACAVLAAREARSARPASSRAHPRVCSRRSAPPPG